MNKKIRIVTICAGASIVAALTAYGVANSISGFSPFATDREMNNNQILFPENGSSANAKNDGENEDSFWKREDTEDKTGDNGGNNGFLFSQDQPAPDGMDSLAPGGNNSNNDNAGTGGIGNGGDIFEIGGNDKNADVILPGGNGNAGLGGVTAGGNKDNVGIGNGGNGGTGNGSGDEDNKPSNPENPPEERPNIKPSGPTPGYGSSSKDQLNTDYVPPTYGGMSGDDHFGSNTKDELDENGDFEVCITAASDPTQSFGEALYKGQKNVDQRTVFQCLEAYVWDHITDRNHYWTLDDLCDGDDSKGYIRIDGLSFGYLSDEIYTEFPMDIPEDEDEITVWVSYRLTEDSEWQEYATYDWWLDESLPGVPYTLYDARVAVLNKQLTAEGEVIDPDSIINKYNMYTNLWNDKLNLLEYQNGIIGNQGDRLTALFPCWLENGEEVPSIYFPTYGRHVLEPANMIPLDSKYQVEVLTHWMNSSYEIMSGYGTYGDSFYVHLQAMTYYSGDDKVDDWVERIIVPQYVQTVEFKYHPGVTTDYIDLPKSTFYIDTSGIMSVDDSPFLYGIGLSVKKGYIVEEGNPHYTSENGLLYNLDKTEILGVPTEVKELVVPSGVTKVILPYQNSVKTLVLEFESEIDIPEINYDRLLKNGKIIVPDEMLGVFLNAESETIQRKQLTVIPRSQWEQNVDKGYTLINGFMYSTEMYLHEIMRESVHWITLPDSVKGIEKDAFTKQADEISVVILPTNGSVPEFEEGCFDCFENLTVACCSEEQMAAAEKIAEEYEGKIRVKMIESHNGYTYLETDSGYLLLGVPDGIEIFDGTFETPDGVKIASVIGDNVFENCYSLKWVVLPEETKAVGYKSFEGCVCLEGVLIKSKDEFLLGKDAFANCSLLRFIGSNAAFINLEDEEFKLTESRYSGSFLFAPTNSVGYSSNWASFTEASDVVSYELVDCGGTKVLYGLDSENTPGLALRAGAYATDTVTMPETTIELFCYAFKGTRSVTGDGAMTVDFENTPNLRWIDEAAFLESDIGENVVLPTNATLGYRAFQSCNRLINIELPGDWDVGISVADEALSMCKNLKSVTFGYFGAGAELPPMMLAQSTATDIYFTGAQPPYLYTYGIGVPYSFESEMEAQGLLRIHVPEGCENDYLLAWRYGYAGYPTTATSSGYQVMWETVGNLLYNKLGREPTVEELLAEIDSMLNNADAALRTLFGMEQSEDGYRRYTFDIDEDGFITLVKTNHVGGYISFLTNEMDLPEGWSVDYIGKGAFAGSPELRDVIVPDTLVGIYSGAFEGVVFDEEDEFDGLNLYLDSAFDIFDLIIDESGTAFSFGVDDSKISITSFDVIMGDEEALATYIQMWTLPMAGYTDIGELEIAVREQLGEDAADDEVLAEMESVLLVAENRVRTILNGVDLTEQLTFSFELFGNTPTADAE